MSNVISKEMLANGVANTPINGILMMRRYSVSLTKTGKEYIQGVLQSQTEISFKAWNSSNAFDKLKNEDYVGQVVQISGTFDNYNNELSIVLNDVVAVEWDDMSIFMPVKYDVAAYWAGLINMFNDYTSEKAQAIANKALFQNEEVANAFKKEFAAQSYHDNCVGGLLAHTYKVLVNVINYDRTYAFADTQDKKDLLALGALLHDIGKTKEMHLGAYQRSAMVTHRYLAVEMIDRDLCIQSYGEEWWQQLVSIFLQHHNEFDDKCRTVWAYIVYIADVSESRLALLRQSMETPQKSEVGDRVKIDGNWLII